MLSRRSNQILKRPQQNRRRFPRERYDALADEQATIAATLEEHRQERARLLGEDGRKLAGVVKPQYNLGSLLGGSDGGTKDVIERKS